MSDYLGVAIRPDVARLMYTNKNSEASSEAMDGIELRFNEKRPYDTRFPSREESVVVQRLPISATLPANKINSMSTGKQEQFAVSLGFKTPEASPSRPTIALWASLKSKRISSWEYLYGGPDLNVFFKMDRWLGKDGRAQGSQDTLISLTQPASSLRFNKKSNVSSWQLIQEAYRGSLTANDASIDWTEGDNVYVRWKYMASLTSAEVGAAGTLLLESMVLPDTKLLESLPPAKQEILSKGSCTTFVLW